MRIGRPGVGSLEAARQISRVGAALAQSPKAPSMCTQAPCSWARAMRGSKGSNAPVFTLPACRHTIVGPLIGGSASARMRPWPSTAACTMRERPSPSMPRDLRSVGWASPPVSTVTGGAPNRPWRLDVEADVAEHRVACRGKSGEIRNRRPGHERPGARRWKLKELEQPAQCDSLKIRSAGRDPVVARVLVDAPASQFAASACGSSRRSRNRRSAGLRFPWSWARSPGRGAPASCPHRCALPAAARPTRAARQWRWHPARHAAPAGRPGSAAPAARHSRIAYTLKLPHSSGTWMRRRDKSRQTRLKARRADDLPRAHIG